MLGLIKIMSLDLSNNPNDYVIRLIQQSQDKRSLLTHDHSRHGKEEEEEHKIK